MGVMIDSKIFVAVFGESLCESLDFYEFYKEHAKLFRLTAVVRV
jgi:hypothetical protein